MKLKVLALAINLIVGLSLVPCATIAQEKVETKPAGDPPQLEVDTWQWGGTFNVLLDGCNRNNTAKSCFALGRNYVLAGGGFKAFAGTQEKIHSEMVEIVKKEHEAIADLVADGVTTSETLSLMQSWARQAQDLASSILAGAKQEEEYLQWALWFLDRGCKLGSGDACADLSLATIYRIGAARVPTVLQELDGYCSKGIGNACDYLGNFYSKGEYFPKSASQAAKFYEQGCGAKEKNLNACLAIAKKYETGDGVAMDKIKAREVYRFLCKKADDTNGCKEMNRLEKETDHAVAPFFELGEKLFPELYKDLKKLGREETD